MAQQGTKPGFGSFNSGNVDDMIRSDDWVAPQRPTFIQALVESDIEGQEFVFGREMRRRQFLLDPMWTFVNHGAFGSPLKVAFEAANEWRRHAELQPLRFIDRELFPYIVKVTKRLSSLVNCKPSDLVLVPNATTALNAVLNSVPLEAGDSVFYLDCTYASVKKMIKHKCKACGATSVEHKLPLSSSLTHEDIVQEVADNLPSGCRLAVFDHVSSNEALLLPVRALAALCHARGVLVLVDGAHGLGATQLDLAAVGADYYAGNCHKWLCAPRGVGFLFADHARLLAAAPPDWVAVKQERETVCSEKACERVTRVVHDAWAEPRAPLISHGHQQGFASEFIWDGARDYAGLLGTELCLDFWAAVPLYAANGHRPCRFARKGTRKLTVCAGYSRALLAWAVEFLSRRWASGPLLPLAVCATMALVRLPAALQPEEGADAADAARERQDALYNLRVECPVKSVGGALHVRVSCWVHNAPADFVALAAAVDRLAGTAHNTVTTNTTTARGRADRTDEGRRRRGRRRRRRRSG